MLSVREIGKDDIALIAGYWLTASPAFLKGMGVDTAKMPTPQQWADMLSGQLSKPYKEKQSYCIIFLLYGQPVGHCNVNKIVYGAEAYMHLHLWDSSNRKAGLGVSFVKMAMPYFFDNLKLKKLLCEPYALNPAPNKTLTKLGFTFVKKYITIPGWLNFEQPVNLWEIKNEG